MLLFKRNLMVLIGALLLAFQSMAAEQGTEIHFNSSCDFKQLTMNIIEEQNINPDYITLNIKLQTAANTRLMQVTRNHSNQKLTTYINGLKINTATIRDELNSGMFSIEVDKKTAQELFPGLLNTQCLQ